MEISAKHKGLESQITELFASTFTASEGADEGKLVGSLAKDLLNATPAQDMYVFFTGDDAGIVGCIIFTRMRFVNDHRNVFVLSPVAVRTDMQGKGIGQELLSFGLESIRLSGVDIVLTYGDPNYYNKVGFEQIDEEFAPPPFKLTYPHGWLGQRLNNQAKTSLKGPSRCVDALNKQAYW